MELKTLMLYRAYAIRKYDGVSVMNKKLINVGVGFATGRKNFKQVARTYVENWFESGLTEKENLNLNLIVAYDLKYRNTKPSDYKDLDKRVVDILDYPFFISESVMKKESATLVNNGVIDQYEAELLFGDGYAKKRNAIMYFAIKNEMDYLLFVDDDEYPMASMKSEKGIFWKGQHVLETHLKSIERADITHGYHCGYVSPIPHIKFNEKMSEQDFQLFIETISNDIVSWDSIREKMADGGVTYADENIVNGGPVFEVQEVNGAKFISGSNLLIKLNTDSAIYPFYNPPGARGEDTFLSTCLTDLTVLKVPCYAFHDGFAKYTHLLCGILPNQLKPISAVSSKVRERFFNACIGWIRYKPLLMYITKRSSYTAEISQMKSNLKNVLPKVCEFFDKTDFMQLEEELDHYEKRVQEHYEMFQQTKTAWIKVQSYLEYRSSACFDTLSAK